MSRGESKDIGRRGVIGRRALIGGAVGSIAAAAVRGVYPDRALAADGSPVILGQSNDAQHHTVIDRTNRGSKVYLAADSYAVLAHVEEVRASAVWGEANAPETTAIRGYLTNNAPRGTAVSGVTDGSYTQVAVEGLAIKNEGEGIGVRGLTKNGIALYGEAQEAGGYGLQVVGRAVFNRSGKTTIAGGQSTKTISSHAVTPATLVIATVQGNPSGVWVKSVSLNDANDTFTIRLNKAAPPGGVVVGFFIVN
jgi:hypothetical protein